MIMTQVLNNILRGDFTSFDDLPANIRNTAILDLVKLANEGKLSGRKAIFGFSFDKFVLFS